MNPNFENFSKGDFITVLQGQRLNPLLGVFVGYDLSEKEMAEPRYDNSYKGEVLEIMATDYPFLVLKNKSNNDNVITLDCRQTVFKKLSVEFVKASLSKDTK